MSSFSHSIEVKGNIILKCMYIGVGVSGVSDTKYAKNEMKCLPKSSCYQGCQSLYTKM